MASETPRPASAEILLSCFQRMLVIRYFEEALSELFTKNLLGGTSHFCIGQEACAVGVVSALRETDWLVSNHRGHGHLLARGLDPARVMGELLGKLTGYCGGRGGSQHMCSMADHFLGTNGITGGGIPLGTGAALAIRYRQLADIVVVFFGDGASNQGMFHESLNMAALWRLPVLYVCENNGYGMSNPVRSSTAGVGIAERAAAYGLRGERRDGMDVVQIRDAAGELADYVRQGNGPAVLELTTYRHCGHSKNDPRVYRTPAEENDWQACDCLLQAAAHLTALGLSAAAIDAQRQEARQLIDAAVRAAMAAPCGTPEHARGGVYA